MKRDLGALADQTFDLLVVGGGIYGACALWDAAQRGLKAALIEQRDFGHATSSNSMKTIHGGLRYLQDLNLPLVRRMAQERSAWLRIAPHLVRPLPMLFPTSGRGLHSKPVLRAALLTTDLLGFDRNRGLDGDHHLPASQVLGRDEVFQLLPGLPSSTDVSGAAFWYDAQVTNSEQLLLSILKSAVDHGAVVANYVRAESILVAEGAACGAVSRDLESGETFDIRSRFVLNAAGPWVEDVLAPQNLGPQQYQLSRAVNIILPQFIQKVGVGLRSRVQKKAGSDRPQAGKVLFVVPWNGLSILGTMHGPPVHSPDQVEPIEAEIGRLLAGINEAYPGVVFDRSDVLMVHSGLQPLDPGSGSGSRPDLLRESRLIDHQKRHGIMGLISLVGVKYTSARWLAEQAIDHVLPRLGLPSIPARTRTSPVFGGRLESVASEVERVRANYPSVARAAVDQLVRTYGSEAEQVLAHCASDPNGLRPIAGQERVLRCQIQYAVQEEMARTPSDFILRRTDLGSGGPPSAATTEEVKVLMGQALDFPPVELGKTVEAGNDLRSASSYEAG